LGQEFVIKSPTLESKINQLLPSQGGQQAGVDLSASTMVVPIVDLTESAEGSNLRQDLQTSLGFKSVTAFSVANAASTIINTTGYFRIFGTVELDTASVATISITDGASTKILYTAQSSSGIRENLTFDFNTFLRAGDSIDVTSNAASCRITGVSRQIATITGDLVDP